MWRPIILFAMRLLLIASKHCFLHSCQRDMEAEEGPPWASAPLELLVLIFARLPLRDRCGEEETGDRD